MASDCHSVSANGSAWPELWVPMRRCCCSTSRRPTSMRGWNPGFWTPSCAAPGPARRYSWWATASPSWPSAITCCTWVVSSMLELLRPRWSRLLLAIVLGVLSLGSALALAGISAWLITRAWQMPPVLDLTVAVVAVRALGISRGVFGYCQRLASHDTALRAAANVRERLYRRLADAPEDSAMRRSSGELVARAGAGVDDLADVLVRAVLPIAVAAVLSGVGVVVIAVISPAAAAVLAACLLVAGVGAPWRAARAVVSSETVAVEHHSRRDDAVMLALEHAPELRVAGRLGDVVAEAQRRHRDRGRAADRAAAPGALAGAVPTVAIGVSVL